MIVFKFQYELQLNIIIILFDYQLMIKLTFAILVIVLYANAQIMPATNTQYAGVICYIQNSDGGCTQCSFGFYKSGSTCVAGQTNCKTFNPNTGNCRSCYIGYSLTSSSKCVVDSNIYLLQGCSRVGVNPNGDNVCLECSSGYYFNYEGNCELIDTLCSVFNYETFRCSECYNGYIYKLNQNRCVASELNWDSNCVVWQDTECLLCNTNFELYNNMCLQTNPNCKNYLPSSNKCEKCYDNYELINNICVYSPQMFNNFLCSSYRNNICQSCHYKAVLNELKQCIPVNPVCLTYNQIDGSCSSCYQGYLLYQKSCILEVKYRQNPFCSRWSSNACLSCAPWSYRRQSDNICVLVNPLCRTYNQNNGNCLNCYNGYTLSSGTCLYGSSSDPNCQTLTTNGCSRCYGGYYFRKLTQKCQILSKNCQQYDEDGNCTKCYGGYYVNDGECELIDPQCSNFNHQKKQCQNCYGGYSLIMGKCQITK